VKNIFSIKYNPKDIYIYICILLFFYPLLSNDFIFSDNGRSHIVGCNFNRFIDALITFRPFANLSECAESIIIYNLKNYSLIKFFNILTIIFIYYLLKKIFQSPLIKYSLIFFITSSGIVFWVSNGIHGTISLLSIILAIKSFNKVNNKILSGLFLLLSMSISPVIFTFVFVLLFLSFFEEKNYYSFIKNFLFFIFIIFLYMFIIKIFLISFNLSLPETTSLNYSPQPSISLEKLIFKFKLFYQNIFTNFLYNKNFFNTLVFPLTSIVLFFLSFIIVYFNIYEYFVKKFYIKKYLTVFLSIITTSFFTIIFLIVSMAPYLVSNLDVLVPHQILPFFGFFIFSGLDTSYKNLQNLIIKSSIIIYFFIFVTSYNDILKKISNSFNFYVESANKYLDEKIYLKKNLLWNIDNFKHNSYYENPNEYFIGLTIKLLKIHKIKKKFDICLTVASCSVTNVHILVGSKNNVEKSGKIKNYFIINTKY
jgi:hypothetical protein